MRLSIALTADPELPVPPKLYGGIERIIDMLARGLTARGHHVTLFAHRDSKTAGRLIAWPGLSSSSALDTARNAAALLRETYRGRFDLIHSFSRVAYLTPILPLAVPKIMTYQRPVTLGSVKLGYGLSRGTLDFTAISHWMMGRVQHIGQWSMIPNGVPLNTFQFEAAVTDCAPLVFLGRVEEIKGPHIAIQIAKRTGVPLVIAGNVPAEQRAWFEAKIAPEIDGHQITYIGPVDDHQKNKLLMGARALLMPILWDEPFGIVMAEAMACGTPVLGLNRGAVPEVVEDGVTGFVRDDEEGLVSAVQRLGEIARVNCRKRVEILYSSEAIVGQYLEVYQNRIAAHRKGLRFSRLSSGSTHVGAAE